MDGYIVATQLKDSEKKELKKTYGDHVETLFSKDYIHFSTSENKIKVDLDPPIVRGDNSHVSHVIFSEPTLCLLYTSDAADE